MRGPRRPRADLKRVDLRLVQLHAAKSAAPFGNGFCQKRHRCCDPFVFGIVGKSDQRHARFFVGFARRHIAAFDVAARAGDMRAIGRADARLALDATPVPHEQQDDYCQHAQRDVARATIFLGRRL
jgi:hypothetical protein